MVKEKEELVNLGALYFPGQLKLGATGLVRNLVFKIEIKNDREGCPILVNASTNTSAEVDTQPHKTKINKRSGSKQHTKTYMLTLGRYMLTLETYMLTLGIYLYNNLLGLGLLVSKVRPHTLGMGNIYRSKQ